MSECSCRCAMFTIIFDVKRIRNLKITPCIWREGEHNRSGVGVSITAFHSYRTYFLTIFVTIKYNFLISFLLTHILCFEFCQNYVAHLYRKRHQLVRGTLIHVSRRTKDFSLRDLEVLKIGERRKSLKGTEILTIRFHNSPEQDRLPKMITWRHVEALEAQRTREPRFMRSYQQSRLH